MKDPAKDDQDEGESGDEPDEGRGEQPDADPPSDQHDAAAAAAKKEEAEPAAPDDDPDRPAFARDWPKSPDLDRLVLAFQRGNYAFVRSEAPRVAQGTANARVRAAANDLRRRIDPDPLAAILMLVAIALLVTLSGYYLSGAHKHDETPAPNVKPQPVPVQPRSSAR